MLRPSDVAPKTVHFDSFSFEHEKIKLNISSIYISTDQIVLESSGSMSISLHDIKMTQVDHVFKLMFPQQAIFCWILLKDCNII